MDLIILAGMPASGKTTFSFKLSQALNYPVLEKETVEERKKEFPFDENFDMNAAAVIG